MSGDNKATRLPRLDPRIVCDCCRELATVKRGPFPHYLCEQHSSLTPQDAAVMYSKKHGVSQ